LGDQDWQPVSDRWAEFERLYKAGATYSAFTRLGEIENYLGHRSPKGAPAEKWRTRLREVRLSDADVGKARGGALESLERLTRMTSVGTRFSYEELLLAITMRVELEVFADFLKKRSLAVDLDTAAVDRDLVDLARSGENAATFRSAQNAARTNWGIPLKSSWLEKL
jgi:hypothetical protein